MPTRRVRIDAEDDDAGDDVRGREDAERLPVDGGGVRHAGEPLRVQREDGIAGGGHRRDDEQGAMRAGSTRDPRWRTAGAARSVEGAMEAVIDEKSSRACTIIIKQSSDNSYTGLIHAQP